MVMKAKGFKDGYRRWTQGCITAFIVKCGSSKHCSVYDSSFMKILFNAELCPLVMVSNTHIIFMPFGQPLL